MKKYSIKKEYILSNSLFLIFPILLTIMVLFEENNVEQGEIIGLGIFWIFGLLILFFLLGSKLIVQDNYIKGSFLGFSGKKIEKENIISLEYRNLLRGGLGIGKGLIISMKTKYGTKTITIGEKAYGKEAIDHIRGVLEQKTNNNG